MGMAAALVLQVSVEPFNSLKISSRSDAIVTPGKQTAAIHGTGDRDGKLFRLSFRLRAHVFPLMNRERRVRRKVAFHCR
jgi:hypothetical protein